MDAPEGAPKKVAIVHDWLYGGGAERVVYELHKLYPEAPIYTSYCSDEWRRKLDNKVITGYLQHWPFSKLRRILPVLRIKWFEGLDLSQYDLVISSSGNGEAKGVKAGSTFREGQTHVCYCHTPTHFYWRHYDQYMRQPGFGAFDPVVRIALKLLLGPLRKWDLKAAQRPDHFIANSTHIQADIKTYYSRDSTVIFPPVDVSRFEGVDAGQPRHGFITVGRQQPQKKTDIIIQACNQLKLPLTVIGNGVDHARLVRLAGPTITFVSGKEATDELISAKMAQATAFIFAAHDDFGITPIEALAAGTPVIAYRAGGALDYVQPGVTGEFFDEQSVQSLASALEAFDPSRYEAQQIRQASLRFSTEAFVEHMTEYLNTIVSDQPKYK
jgi:glycosyltransferase involved in cell wall biosynthesis